MYTPSGADRGRAVVVEPAPEALVAVAPLAVALPVVTLLLTSFDYRCEVQQVGRPRP